MARREKMERYFEWLERMEVPLEATTDIETFQEWLATQIEVPPEEWRPGALQDVWTAVQAKYETLAPRGVRPIRVEYPWGWQLRWAIKGYPGLWGYRRMMEITGWRP